MAQAVERRLPAIYDALDSRNNKLTLKLIASALQKQPKSQTLRVLKAVALQRSGKDEEGLQVCETVRREVPTDEQVLNTMCIVYRRANRMKDLSAAFAAASTAHPQDKGLLRGVFVSYVRGGDYAGQQQTASKLHKLIGASDDYYIWWTIAAITLQAKAAQKGAASALPADKLFQLAEAMTAKQAQKGSLQTYEQLSLYLDILQAQGKQQQALQLVEGALGDAISMPAERRTLRASLYVALKQQGQAAALFKEALLHNPDDWTSLQSYLDCILTQTTQVARNESDSQGAGDGCGPLGTGDGCGPQGAEDPNQLNGRPLQNCDHHQTAFQEAEETLQELLTKVQSDPKLREDAARGVIRGPQLAQVEFELRKLAHDKQRHTGLQEKGQQGEEVAVERQDGSTTAGHCEQPKGEPEGQGVQAERQEGTKALAESVLTYYRQLGHMLSCAVDLRAYTKRIQGQSRTWLAQQLQAELDGTEHQLCNGAQQLPSGEFHTEAAGGSPNMKELLQLRRQISAYQIQHDLGLIPESAAAAEAHAIKLVKLYKHSLSLCKGLDPKEKGPGDDLIPLAVASLMAARHLDMAGSTDSASAGVHDRIVQKQMIQALLVCEASQKRSTVFAASRLASSALYGLLGAAGPALTNFSALAIKHIQHDTITGHHLLPVALACQDTATLDKLLTETTQLFEDHDRDAADTIMMAFDKGTFTKVIEFVEFKERLERSHALAVARSEQSLIKIRKAISRGFTPVQSAVQEASRAQAQSSSMGQDSELSLDQLRFNEDLSTRPPWLPPCGGPVGGCLMDWWQEQQKLTSDTGYGRCWWAQPSAAELPDQDALALRQDRQRQLHIRRLMPHVMLSLTTFQTAAEDQSAAAVREANGASQEAVQESGHEQGLPQLSALLGVPYCQLDSWLGSVSRSSPQLPQRWPSEEEVQESTQPELARCSPSQAHQLISLAAFAAADAGKDCWSQRHHNAVEPTSGSLDSHSCTTTFMTRLAAVQGAFSSSCQQLTQQLKLESDHMLLGSTLLAAVHLVSEPAVWLCVCMLAWQHHFGDGGAAKKQGKKDKGGGVSEGTSLHQSELQLIREQLSHIQHAYCEGLQRIVDALSVRLKVTGKAQLANATTAALGDAGQSSDLVQALAGCLSWADIQAVLNGIITAQALTLKRVKLQASELISAV